MSTISSSLKKLREIAPQLNKAADDASAIVKEVETELTRLNIGIEAEAWVRSTNKTETNCENVSLVYRRVRNSFRIAVLIQKGTQIWDERGESDMAWETITETPWAECPRELKVESFPHLPELLENIVSNAESAKTKVEAAQAEIRKLLSGKE
jgi:hypothetical protein